MDLPSLRIEDAVAAAGSTDARAAKKKDRAQRGPAAMSHISGVKRPLTHTNSFTGERVPLHGVETPHEEELGKVGIILLLSIPFHGPEYKKNFYFMKKLYYSYNVIEICNFNTFPRTRAHNSNIKITL